MDFVRFSDPGSPGLNEWASQINTEANLAGGVPPCLLAAIVDRETGGRNVLQEGMPPGPGCGVGLTQITSGVDWTNPGDPTFEGYRLLDPSQNLYVAAAFFLKGLIKQATEMQHQNPEAFAQFGNGQIAYYVAAGYNAGWGAVQFAVAHGIDPDSYTTDKYASWVLNRYEQLVQASHASQAKK